MVQVVRTFQNQYSILSSVRSLSLASKSDMIAKFSHHFLPAVSQIPKQNPWNTHSEWKMLVFSMHVSVAENKLFFILLAACSF